MENINFRGIPTSLFLNGPKVGIVTDPQSLSNVIGVATFTGIATASFPDTNFALDGGSIAFKWYFDGSRILDSSEDSNSNARIDGFDSLTGTGSTIQINGLGVGDDGKEIYFEAEYVPSAYSQPTGSAVTAGTARSTGNAFNEPLKSGIGTISVFPIIDITTQPTGQLVSVGDDAKFSIAAQKTPGGGAVNYQWQLNGTDLSDGTSNTNVFTGASGTPTLTINDGTTDVVVDFSKVSVYDTFTPGVTYTATANADITVKLIAEGGGGGGSGFRNVGGSKGGRTEGTFTFLDGQTYIIQVGEAGQDGATLGGGTVTGAGGKPGGGDAPSFEGNFNRSGAGGGYTGIFITSVTQANAILIAGGGGGSTGDPARGGDGGGESGNDGSNGNRAGKGGTQTAGGASGTAGTAGEAGSALQGGKGADSGVGAAGGGGGYFGGGGGTTAGPGTGGGGSSYLHPTLITNGTTTTGGSTQGIENDGTLLIELVSAVKSVTTTITGANTPNLTISSTGSGIAAIRCKVTATDVQESPRFSNTVSYVVVEPRSILGIETYNYANATATLSEFDLANGDLTIDYASYTGNAVCLYSGDKDIDVEMEMYGGKGPTATAGVGADGGDGGYSKIRFTMERDVEYVLTGLFSAVNAPFLYRKASLIAVVGAGGAGAPSGGNDGGQGGGIGVAGEKGGNREGGSGGPVVQAGQGTLTGIFGGNFDGPTLTGGLVPPDIQRGVNSQGGNSIICARGVYWRNQGKSPCDDVGTVKFRTPDGTEISNTATIERGYKSGYNVIQTAGGGRNDKSGDGGCGFTGGGGGDNRGGGGGSGYTDGSVTVVSTQLGGSDGDAKVIIRIADPSTIAPSTTLQEVTFTVTRSSVYSNTLKFEKESGTGPDEIIWGPNAGTVTVSMGAGAVYKLPAGDGSLLINGASLGKSPPNEPYNSYVRLKDGVIEIEENPIKFSDYDSLTITPNKGKFTSNTRYEFT